jgi:hypothetical protein
VPTDEGMRMRADARAALDAIGAERLPDDPAVRTIHARSEPRAGLPVQAAERGAHNLP